MHNKSAREEFQNMLKEAQAPLRDVVTPEYLARLAEKVSDAHALSGADPTAEVEKIASDHPYLNAEHIKRICEKANQAIHLRMYKSAGADKNVTFPLADSRAVLASRTVDKTASARTISDDSFSRPVRAIDFSGLEDIEKTASPALTQGEIGTILEDGDQLGRDLDKLSSSLEHGKIVLRKKLAQAVEIATQLIRNEPEEGQAKMAAKVFSAAAYLIPDADLRKSFGSAVAVENSGAFNHVSDKDFTKIAEHLNRPEPVNPAHALTRALISIRDEFATVEKLAAEKKEVDSLYSEYCAYRKELRREKSASSFAPATPSDIEGRVLGTAPAVPSPGIRAVQSIKGALRPKAVSPVAAAMPSEFA